MVRKLKFDYKECLRLGLLRKIPASKEKAERSIETASKWIDEAARNLENNSFNSSVLASYLAMFHSARAILFFDGYREKSHICITKYLEEFYVKRGLLENKWIELLDHYRRLRHDDQYSFNFYVTREEAENALEIAKEFAKEMKKLLEQLKSKYKNVE
jgi:uncharacterized protein (UPF0332 family)